MAPDFAQHNRIEMPAEEIDCLLREEGVGILSLADDGVAYGIPLSFGYDADRERLYFVFLRPGESSKKAEFTERITRASFTVQNAPSRDQWENVIADDELHQVDNGDWNHVRDALEDNAWYPTLLSGTEPMQGILGWELRIDSRLGFQRRRV